MFEGYKANRKGMPQELAQQLTPLKEILTAMGYPIVAVEGYMKRMIFSAHRKELHAAR
jgi:DNA polymerase-1